MCLIDLAQSNPNLVISVCAESFPHLRKGAMRDFLAIMTARGYFDDKAWSKSEFTYTFPNGTIIEFFSVDKSEKVRGPGRDVLFINECNNVLFETYRQLALRTRKVIYLDCNPVAEFWAHTGLLSRPDADYVQLTYLNNEALPRSLVREIELLKSNDNLWRDLVLTLQSLVLWVTMLTSTVRGLRAADWRPWQVRTRRDRLLVRPLIELGEAEIALAPHYCYGSANAYLNHLTQGMLPWSSPAPPKTLDRALADYRDERNKALERRVTAILSSAGYRVRAHVKPQDAKSIGLDKLEGEVDDVAGRAEFDVLWLLEVKDLQTLLLPAIFVDRLTGSTRVRVGVHM